MVKTVIFDVDGTLLDTERIGMQAWKDAAARFGYDIPEAVLLATRGVSRKDGMQLFYQAMGPEFPYDQLQPLRIRLGEERIQNSRTLVKPGVWEVLDFLKEKNVPMAVASSTVYAITQAHLQQFGLYDYFDAVVGGDMISRGKPNPDIFLKAAGLLGYAAEDCLVIEDSPAGVRAANAAGMQVILIPDCIAANAETSAASLAVLNTMEELLPILAHVLKT